MSLILKQEPANTIATPPAGKSTLFVNDNSVMSVKSPDGNVTTFPTVQGANTQVLFNDNGALNGNANLVFNKTSATMTVTNLSVTGNLDAGDINVSSIANGTSNVDIIGASGNVTTSVGGVANVLVITTTGANVTGTFSASGNANVGNIGATGGIFTTVGGELTTAAQPNITSTGTLTSLSVSGNISAGNVSATTFTGALSGAATSATTAGTVTTAAQPNITSTGTLTSLSVSGNANVGNLGTAGIITATGNITGGNISGTLVTGTLTTGTQPNITGLGILTALSVSGSANIGNMIVDGSANIIGTLGANIVTASGNVIGANLVTTGIANITGNVNGGNLVTAGQVSATGNITGGNISGTLLTGTLTTAAQPNITSTGTLASLSVTGNVTGGNLVTAGILSVTGTGVSSIAGNLDMTSNNIINLASPVNATDAATKQYVDDVAQGLHTHDSCNAATTTTLATISGGTVTYNNGTSGVGATLTTTGSYTTIDGVTLSDGMRILVKNEVSAANNGIYVRTSSTVLTRADDFNTPAEMAGGDFTFVTAGTVYDNTGWVMPDPVTTVGTSPVVWVQFSGAGTYTAGSGLTLTGSVFSVNVAQPTITSVGTLTSLSISGNANIGNVGAAAGVFTSVSGNGSALSAITGANVTGTVPLATSAGTVTTAAQPNITSLGTLSSLSVSGNANVGNIGATNLVGTLTTGTQTNITSLGTLSSLSVSGNANVGNIGATNLVGTLSTASQTNITAVGTLTSLGVSGNANVGNLGTGGLITVTGNVTAGNLITGGLVTVTGNVTAGNLVSTGTVGGTGATHLGNTFTTGANTTTATVTGNFALSSGSRFQATYA